MHRFDEPISIPGFGLIEAGRVLHQNDLLVVVLDKYPVSAGHCLVIPKRAVVRFSELTPEEKARLMTRIDWTIAHLESTLVPVPDGFNVGLNDGVAAGQTVAQLHVHIIPRHHGDVADPRGGVRWVLPSKARYWHDL